MWLKVPTESSTSSPNPEDLGSQRLFGVGPFHDDQILASHCCFGGVSHFPQSFRPLGIRMNAGGAVCARVSIPMLG